MTNIQVELTTHLLDCNCSSISIQICINEITVRSISGHVNYSNADTSTEMSSRLAANRLTQANLISATGLHIDFINLTGSEALQLDLRMMHKETKGNQPLDAIVNDDWQHLSSAFVIQIAPLNLKIYKHHLLIETGPRSHPDLIKAHPPSTHPGSSEYHFMLS